MRSVPEKASYDVVIIGGAIMGSSLAWWLTETAGFDGDFCSGDPGANDDSWTALSELAAVTSKIRLGLSVDFRQTNHEGTLVDWIQEASTGAAAGIVINPGAYTHTSVAIHDAIRSGGKPVIELHLSNIFAREAFRHHSYVSPVAVGVICGFGPAGYVLALEALKTVIEDRGRKNG